MTLSSHGVGYHKDSHDGTKLMYLPSPNSLRTCTIGPPPGYLMRGATAHREESGALVR